MRIDIPKKNTAVLLVGGGAAGIVNAAYLDATLSVLTPDAIYGSSVGAINGAVALSSGQAALWDVWSSIKNSKVYHSNPLTWAAAMTARAAIYDSAPLAKLLQAYIHSTAIQQSAIPFYLSVTDVQNERSFNVNARTVQGDLWRWVLASGSPPVFFPAVTIHGRQYYDAGLGENINISYAIRNGAERLIILCPRGKSRGRSIDNVIEALKFTIGMPQQYMLEKELRFVEAMNSVPGKRLIEVVLIRPTGEDQPAILDFDALGSRTQRKALWDRYYSQALTTLRALT